MKLKINALLEIGCEEIPARFMPGFLEELKKKAEEKISANRLTYEKIETFGTPRRLVLSVEDLLEKQPDITEDVQGPPAEAAFDRDNKPTPAAIGFAKKHGVKIENIGLRTVGNKNYVFATVKRKGQPAEKLLASLFPEIISSLYLPLSMRWGEQEFKFIRPIHWILALCGKKTVKFELAGIKSSNLTYGHRYFKNSKLKVKNPKKEYYIKELRKYNVVVDQNERKERIKQAVKKVAPGALLDNDLLDEVTYLVENPVVYKGKFDPEFLSLPTDVLITSMKKNQKYFPILDGSGKLSSGFVVVTDNCQNAKVVLGNQKVLSARLHDAMFFFNEDKKIPLKVRIPDLKRIEFFENLGSMYEKSERIKKLSQYLAKQLKIDENQTAKITKIAELSKADLTTHMVFEFPELQGIMGREYALVSQEDPEVAQGIFEHYLPRHAEDILPKSIFGCVVALADKIDTLAGCFSQGKIPSGSEDPYGLRRAAHGIVRIVLENKLDLLLDEIFDYSLRLYENQKADYAKNIKSLQDFLGGRLKVILIDEKIPPTVIEAALSQFNDILEAKEVAQTIAKNIKADWFLGVVMTQSRLSRIAKDAKREQIIETDFLESVEKDLQDLYLKINWNVSEKINAGDYEGALHELGKFTQPVEEFFQKVLVMHEDERIKLNRLALLKSIEKAYLKVADLTKLQV